MPIELRPIWPEDRDLLDAFHRRQSRESIYFRYFQYRPKLSSRELDFFTQVDYVERMAFVALLGGELVGVARYEEVAGSDRPELAFFVDDDHHGRGLATLMLEYLAAAARSQGIAGFTATVLPENHAMLGVFKRAGFATTTWFEDGVIGVDIDIAVTSETADAITRRHQRARSKSVARLLRPGSIAVVGASRRPGTVGHELFRQLIDGGFAGDLHPVNPATDELLGYRCHPSLRAIGQGVDLAIIAVPAPGVEAVVTEAADVGVESLLVVSSGFSESGPDGAERERRIVDIARDNGMRLLGPSSFGLVNTDPEVRLRALFLPLGPDEGSVAMISQSGPLGGGVLERLRSMGVGMSSFVAAGNRADVSVNDVLDYWLVDDATRIALLYVENYGNLRTFARTARMLSASKPLVTLRPHDDGLTELMEQSGVILVDSFGEMAAVARVAGDQPVPEGPRVAVVSNAASVAKLAVSACLRFGLDVVVPDGVGGQVVPGLDAVMIGDVDSVRLDATGAAPAERSGRRLDYEEPLVATAFSADVDAVLAVIVPTLDLSVGRLGRILDRVDRSVDKPVVAAGLVAGDQLPGTNVAFFEFPDDAARAIGHLARYRRWRTEDGDVPAAIDDDELAAAADEVRPAITSLLTGTVTGADGDRADVDGEEGDGADVDLLAAEAGSVVAALRLPVPEWRIVTDRDQLPGAAAEVGYPVVLKAGGRIQRTVGEAGGAAIDLHDDDQLTGAFDRMLAVDPDTLLPAVVQAMVASVANARVELVQDPDVGAFISVGVGGALGAAVAPLARRFLPLLAGDEAELVDAVAEVVPLDQAGRNVLAEIVRRLGVVGTAVPELARVELDPVLIAGADTAIGDIRINLRPWTIDPLAGVRRL